MTIRQQIRDQIIQELNAAPPTGVPEATKRRWVPGRRLTEPLLAVFFGPTETSSRRNARFPIDDRELLIGIQAAIAVEDPAEADDAIETIIEHVADVLGDTPLAGLATNVEELGTEWASAQADLFYHTAVLRFRIRYQTKRGDLSLKQ